MKVGILGVALWGALCALMQAAGLTFEKLEQTVDAAADAKKVEVVFSFENQSAETVTITRYDAPCTCMSAQLEGGKSAKGGSTVFEPGEKGRIKGVFELGNFKGTVEKKMVLWLKGDSEEKPSITLTTKVNIPYLIGAFPTSLTWELGGEPDTKEIQVKVDQEEPIRIVKHSCENPNIRYQFVTVREGFEYQIKVTPHSAEKVTFAAIRLYTDSENPRYKVIQTFMTVKPKKK